MRFWDSSGIVAVVAREIELPQCLALLQTDDEMAVWCWTSVELLSALHRKRRGGDLTAAGWALAAQQVSLLRAHWLEVENLDVVRTIAERLVAQHPLRSADACQLAAALFLAEGDPARLEFVCLDGRLRQAAAKEGLVVVPAT